MKSNVLVILVNSKSALYFYGFSCYVKPLIFGTRYSPWQDIFSSYIIVFVYIAWLHPSFELNDVEIFASVLMFSLINLSQLFTPVQIDRSGKIPMLRFRDRESYAQNKTKEYDAIAMKYLTYVLLFLVFCFSIYSLKYEKHKSWYSWILSSLTSCVYMFGK